MKEFMKKVGDAVRKYFAVTNEVNENVVVGTVFAIALLVGFFTKVEDPKFYTMAATTLAMFGISLGKK